jgi:hypothetical protein
MRLQTTCWPRVSSQGRSGTALFTVLASIALCHSKTRFSKTWQQARKAVPKAARRRFDSAILLTAWMLWKERNRRTFDRVSRTPLQIFHLILEEADAGVGARFVADRSRSSVASSEALRPRSLNRFLLSTSVCIPPFLRWLVFCVNPVTSWQLAIV